MHAAQGAVAAALQGRVDMDGDARGGGHKLQQVVGEIHGLDGAEAQAFDFSFREQAANQAGQPQVLPGSRPQRPRLMPLSTTSR